jgi:hypothetical protein
MKRKRQYDLKGAIGSKKRIQSLSEALIQDSIDERRENYTKHYGARASFWPRLVVYGITSAVLVTTLVFIYNSATRAMSEQKPESRFRMIQDIERTVESQDIPLKDSYKKQELKKQENPFKKDYEDLDK